MREIDRGGGGGRRKRALCSDEDKHLTLPGYVSLFVTEFHESVLFIMIHCPGIVAF